MTAKLVQPFRVLESPVNFECKLTQLIQLQGDDRVPAQTWLVLGEIVVVHIDRELLIDAIFDTALTRPILRAGKLSDYAEI